MASTKPLGKPSAKMASALEARRAQERARTPKFKRGAGRISLLGRMPIAYKVDDPKNPLVPVLIRVPTKLLEALEAHMAGARSAIIVALIAEATARAQRGENIDLDASEFAHWYSEDDD